MRLRQRRDRRARRCWPRWAATCRRRSGSATILALPPAAARDLYEKAQARRERVLMVVTAVLVAGAIAAVVLFKVRR